MVKLLMCIDSGAKKDAFSRTKDILLKYQCGKRGIRTPGTVTRSPHFECGPFDHSGIFPFAEC